MKRFLLIGIGQTGSSVAERFLNKFNNRDVCGKALAIDTDEVTLSEITQAQCITMTDECSLANVVEKLGEQDVSRYFPCEWERDNSVFAKGLEMRRGANLWRMKAFLAFNSFLASEKKAAALHLALDELVSEVGDGDEIAVYVAASLAGGTGSGLLLPMTFYVKKYLENAGAKPASVDAFLAMPDIYKNVLTAERSRKAYANAYATLRELAAVNTVAAGGNDPEFLREHPTVEFKLELGAGAIRTLFDSSKKEFCTPEAAPFDKVTLFESIPTVGQLAEYVSVLADAIFFAYATDGGEGGRSQYKTKTDTVIGCESITRICYPSDSIVDYIVNRQLYTFAADEIGKLGAIAESRLFSKMMNAKNEKRKFNDFLAAYRDSYIISVEDELERSGDLAETLIGRSIDTNEKLDTPSDLYDMEWVERLDSMIEASVINEDLEYVNKLISEKLDSIASTKKKMTASAAKKEINGLLDGIRSHLSGGFITAQTEFKEGQKRFEEAIISDASETGFSIVNDIMCENGAYLHPIYALFRLCLAHRKLESYKKEESQVPLEPRANYPFPKEIMKTRYFVSSDAEKAPSSKYFRYGEYRFRDLMAFSYGEQDVPAESIKKKKAAHRREVVTDDRETFFSDLDLVYKKLISGLKYYRYLSVIERIETLIERYKSFVEGVASLGDEIDAEIRLSLIANSSSNATTVNVGALVQDKERLCDTYLTAYAADIPAMLNNDVRIAGKVASLMLSDTALTVARKDIRTLFGQIKSIYGDHLRSTKFYEDDINRDILEAIKEAVSEEYDKNGLSYTQIFAQRYNPLKIVLEGENRERTRSSVQVILSKGVKKTLDERYKDRTTPAQYVSGIVSEYTEYGTEIEFMSGLGDREMFVRRRREGFTLDASDMLDELSEGRAGYEAYMTSINDIGARQTTMWSPSLIYHRDGEHLLPFIAPRMQTEYELAAAKAVAYTLMKGIMRIDSDEELGEMYFVTDAFDRIPLLWNGEPIKPGDAEGLIRWAYDHTVWTQKYSSKYDAIDKEGAVTRMSITTKLLNVMKSMLIELDEQGSLETGWYSKRLASVVYGTFRATYFSPYGKFEEQHAGFYSYMIKNFFAEMKETLGAKTAKRYAKWLNSIGAFLDYSMESDSFYNFTFK